jgi:hypothetical protein
MSTMSVPRLELLLARAARRSPKLEAILQGLLSGMTTAETASKLGYTERAVEGRLYQFRKTAWSLVQSGRIDPSLIPGSRALVRDLRGDHRSALNRVNDSAND